MSDKVVLCFVTAIGTAVALYLYYRYTNPPLVPINPSQNVCDSAGFLIYPPSKHNYPAKDTVKPCVPNSNNTFLQFQNAWIDVGKKKAIPATSQLQCESLCTNDKDCKAYMYYAGGHQCTLVDDYPLALYGDPYNATGIKYIHPK